MNAYARDLRTSKFSVQLEKLVLIAEASRKQERLQPLRASSTA